MSKIALITKREFLTRVQKKTFLLTTILLPLIIFGFYAMIIYFSVESDDNIKIAVADEADIFKNSIKSKDDISFEFLKNETPGTLKQKVEAGKYSGYLYVPAGTNLLYDKNINVVSGKSVGLVTRDKIAGIINDKLKEERLLSLNISPSQLDSVQQNVQVQFPTIAGNDGSGTKAAVSAVVGYTTGFLIYIILLIYGTMVMRGVMEEKTSRIAEVIVSSVKPFELMMGKIFGIGAVGLVQFIIWVILVFGLSFLLPVFFPGLAAQIHAQPVQPGGMQAANAISEASADPTFLQGLSQVNFPLIIGSFIFYFLGGYLLYSSLFAAVGCSVNEDPQDAQSLTLPIIMPIIFGIVIMTKAVNNPSSGLAVFGSLFPLTSPIVMMARIAHGVPEGVPYWQLALSAALLISGFFFTTWLAGKIYRTGILMYGKKPTWREMIKWGFRKN